MPVVVKINTRPQHIYQRMENAVAIATMRVYISLLRERLDQLAARLVRTTSHLEK